MGGVVLRSGRWRVWPQTLCVVQGRQQWPWSVLEIPTLRPHPKPAESEHTLTNRHVTCACLHVNVGKHGLKKEAKGSARQEG